MNRDAWRSYPSAPAGGAVLCAFGDIPCAGSKSVLVTTPNGEFPVLLVRRSDALHAYVNACPHQYLPLDYRSDRLLSADGTKLVCSSHGAVFEADTGECIGGPAQGCALDPVPVVVGIDGKIRIAGDE